MSRSPFKMATVCHKFQFDFILGKLELILANPLAKVSITLTIGSQKVESTQRPKASKETILKETISFITSLYEDPKKGVFQEKTILIEVCLNNSKVSNVVGILKLDLSNYVHNSADKLETMVLQKSPEYQGKIVFGINAIPLEVEGDDNSNVQINKNFGGILEPNDSISQQDFSDIGKNQAKKDKELKRSVTPNLRASKHPGTDKLMHVVDRMLLKSVDNTNKSEENSKDQSLNRKSSNLLTRSIEKNKLMNLFEPVLNKTNNVIQEYSNDEKMKLEKVISAFKTEKNTNEIRINEQEQKLNEKLKDYEELKIKFLTLEKDSYRMKQENQELQRELEKEKNKVKDLMLGEQDKFEVIMKNDLNSNEKKIEEIMKENAKLIEEKYQLESAMTSQQKATEELNRKLIVQMDENAILKKQTAGLNEFINKKERQIKTLIEEINRGKEKGAAESFIDKTEKLKILEEELKKQDEEMDLLKKNLLEKTNLLKQTQTNLEKSLKESNWQRDELQQLTDKLNNLETINGYKDAELKNYEDLKMNYVKSQSRLADIMNLVFENKTLLIEEIDKLIVP